MRISKIFILVTFFTLFCLTALPGLCENTIKIGPTTFTSNEASVILPVTEDTISISLGGTEGNRVATVNLIFDGLVNQISEGAEFDVVTGLKSEKGKVTINVTDQFDTSSGKVRNFSTDSRSRSRGKLTILSVDGSSGFTFSINTTVSNLLEVITDSQTGMLKNKRSPKKVRISGTVEAVKVSI